MTPRLSQCLHPAGRCARGLTLVELMVALVVGLFLIAGIIQVFLAQRQSYRYQEALSRVQENARYALDWIEREARMSGYLGCDKQAQRDSSLNTNTLFHADWDTPIQGFNATGSGWSASILSAGLAAGTAPGDEVRNGTDILVLRRGVEPRLQLAQAMTSTSDGLRVVPRTPAPIAAGDLLVVSDCKRSTLFQATGYNAATGDIAHAAGSTPEPGNQTTTLSDPGLPNFDRDAEVMRLQTVVLFVGTDNQGLPALRRKLGTDPSEVLVSGVENMQVLYGLDTDGTPDGIANRYVPAGHMAAVQSPRVRPDWQDVVTLRVALLMQSTEGLGGPADTRTYDLLDEHVSPTGTITHAGDGRMRKVVSATISLRNSTL